LKVLTLNAVPHQAGWDFARALAKGLLDIGYDTRIALLADEPMLDDARINARPVVDRLPIVFNDGLIDSVSISASLIEGVFYYLISREVYKTNSTDPMNTACTCLVRGILAGLKAITPKWVPDLVHINDSCPGLAAVYLHALCLSEWDLGRAFLTTVHSHAASEYPNTLVTGTGLGDEVRVIKCYKSPRKLASVYDSIYRQILGEDKAGRLAA
jgi:glycogen synthase